VELASDRKLRTRNKLNYRLAHWPIWIWVFFIAPGPITFDLFAHGPSRPMMLWLGAVILGTGTAAYFGKLPGSEPAPYILRFNEDRPNPIYRRLCYTLAWSEVVSYALLNSAGLIDAIIHGTWRMRAIYDAWYLPIAGTCWLLGAIGWLPRVRRSTKGEGQERRYFYGSVWAVCIAQPILWFFWKALPLNRASDIAKLLIFWGVLAIVGEFSRRGRLPRTRPILPGELVVAD
jgi:hypothetical protein